MQSWIMLLLTTVAVILQAGIGTFPFVLALVVAAGFSSGPRAALVNALGGSILLETISVSPIGVLSIPLLIISFAAFILNQRLFRQESTISRVLMLAGACALAAGLAYGTSQLLTSEPLPWSMWEPLRLAVTTAILAGLWLWVIGRLNKNLRHGFPAA